jgi:hypothetical protein
VPILNAGDRGQDVGQLQQLLNGKPSRLLRLNRDGILGPKTIARIIEFQKDNSLKPDGMAGPLTMAKLQAGGGSQSRDAELQSAMNAIANQLNFGQRQQFLVQARFLVPAGNPNLLGAVQALPIVLIIMFFILIMMVVVVEQSNNKADKEMAREWNRRFERLKESIKGKPLEVQTAETHQEAKQRGKDVTKRIQEDREKCLAQLDPAKLAKCGNVLRNLSQALQSLAQKIAKGSGGRGTTPEGLALGIAESIKIVFEAAKAVAECTGCDI